MELLRNLMANPTIEGTLRGFIAQCQTQTSTPATLPPPPKIKLELGGKG